MKKHHHKRFGTIAVDKGFISEEQLIKALELQATDNIKEGKLRLPGQTFLDEGLLTEAQVDERLETISQRIVYMMSMDFFKSHWITN
ncbi:MAG: hypothetical protein AB1Z29_14655 [Desulfobacterales bacterium]